MQYNLILDATPQIKETQENHHINNEVMLMLIKDNSEQKVYSKAITSPITTTIFNTARYIRQSL
jgi:hypothetical protein